MPGSSSRQAGGRAERTSARKRAILEAALSCWGHGGEDAVVVEAVAARSGASVGSIYHHFGSMEGVLAALYIATLEEYRAQLLGALQGLEAAEALVKALVRHHVAWIVANPDRARLLFRARWSSAVHQVDESLRRNTFEFQQEIMARFDDALADGVIRRLPAAAYQPLLLGPTNELARQWLSGRTGDFSPVDAVDILADAAWQVLRIETG
jgi:AcrR family transcriptional regulator